MSNNSATVREVLERRFPPEVIKTRPSAHGPLSYVETHQYIARLNEAYAGVWSFEIASHEIREDEVLVIGKLITPDCTKMAFGSATIARHKETSEVVDLGDSMKAAASDSLKKACSLLGLGLHLWADDPKENPAQEISRNGNGNGKPNGKPAPPNGNGDSQTNGNGGARLSSKQLGLILALGRDRGLNRDKIAEMTLERFNRKPEFITKSEASWLIQELQSA